MRRVGAFALVFVPAFALCALAYPLLWPAWQKLALGAANCLLAAIDWRLALDPLGGEGWRIALRRPEGLLAAGRDARTLAHFHLGLAILPPLLLATPVAWRARLRLVGLGILLLFAVHVLAVLGMAYDVRCHASGPAPPLCTWTAWKVNVAGELAAFGVWAALTWRIWTQPPPREA